MFSRKEPSPEKFQEKALAKPVAHTALPSFVSATPPMRHVSLCFFSFRASVARWTFSIRAALRWLKSERSIAWTIARRSTCFKLNSFGRDRVALRLGLHQQHLDQHLGVQAGGVKPLDPGRQLADIARPRIAHQHAAHGRTDRHFLALVVLGVERRESGRARRGCPRGARAAAEPLPAQCSAGSRGPAGTRPG